MTEHRRCFPAYNRNAKSSSAVEFVGETTIDLGIFTVVSDLESFYIRNVPHSSIAYEAFGATFHRCAYRGCNERYCPCGG
jgi:hypothetical protein